MRYLLSLLALSIIIPACTWIGPAGQTELNNSLLNRINNRGPIALSPDNPYLVGNLVLADEIARIPALKGFIKHRGMPSAIELQRDFLSNSVFTLYYAEQREFYTLDDSTSAWVVDGPHTIDDRTLKTLPPSEPGKYPLLVAKPELDRILGKSEDASEDSAPDTSSKEFESAHVSNQLMIENEVKLFINAGDDHPAEITPKGDIVHHVTFAGETLSIIARWYTFDAANAGRIARINNSSDPDTLAIGDSIILPGYMIKNKQRLKQEFVDKYR